MSEIVTLDVRPLPPRLRHPRIFQAWEALPVGATLKLVNDHDPKPLYYEFSAERAGEFEWNYVERGPETWAVDIHRIAPGAGGAPARSGERPPWMKDKPDHEMDIRDDLRQGREPFQKLMTAVAAVQPGEVLCVRAVFEPRPLYTVMSAQGYEHWTQTLAPDDWKVFFRRAPGQSKARSPLPERPPCGHQGKGKAVLLDVRGLEPPEPMVRILSALPELGPDGVLEVTHFREPVPLYARLEEAGFDHSIEKLGENLYRLRVFRKG